jgi:hypothetical protein
MRSMHRGLGWFFSAGIAIVMGLAGCGGGGSAEHQVAPVTGRVVHDGQPVNGGSITFRPINVEGTRAGVMGKPASAEVGADGTFSLSTYGRRDGAVVGQHQVIYTAVATGAESYDDKPVPSPYRGLVPQPAEVEVKPSTNEIQIVLVSP